MIKGMSRLTPSFQIDKLRPLYVARFLFMIRLYIMLGVLDYDVMGMLSFPLEPGIAIVINDLQQKFNRLPCVNTHYR